MRLLYLVVDKPGSTPDNASDIAERQRLGQEAMPSGCRFIAQSIPFGPSYYHESSVGLELCVPGVLEAVRRWQDEYDAVLISCFVDPGVRAARTVAKIPVVGPGRSSLALAQTLANRFGIVTILPSNIPDIDYLLCALQIRHMCVGVDCVGLSGADVKNDAGRALACAEEAGKRLLARGAEAVVLGCMAFGLAGLAPELTARLGVPVIDPLRAGIMNALALVQLGIVPSRLSHPSIEQYHHLTSYLDLLRDIHSH